MGDNYNADEYNFIKDRESSRAKNTGQSIAEDNNNFNNKTIKLKFAKKE